MHVNRDLPGQTLVELIAASFVLAVGLVGVLALTTANVRNQTIGNIRLAGSNIAREGIELARNIRDTNWMQQSPWDQGLLDNDEVSRCAVIGETIADFRFVSCGVGTPDQSLFTDPFALYWFNDQLVQIAKPKKEALQTQYYRRIRFDPICLNKTEADFIDGDLADAQESLPVVGVGCGANLKAGIKITSEAGWRGSGGRQTATVVEHIYNWR